MSFSSELKKELCALGFDDPEMQFACAYGLFLFSRTFSPRSVSMQTESPYVLELYCKFMRELIDIHPKITTSIPKKDVKRTYSAVVDDAADQMKILQFFHHRSDEITLRIHGENIDSLAKTSCFLRGAYLACGSISDPTRSYHLEFSTPHSKLSKDFILCMQELSLQPKSVERKGNHIIYLKESEYIEDLLTTMGAMKSSLELMNIKIYKDLRNKANRLTNCETANIEKTVVASSAQVEDIQFVLSKRGIDFLPDELKEIALLRIEQPEMSLRELGESLSEPLSRSGANHRLKRLSVIAQDLRRSKGK